MFKAKKQFIREGGANAVGCPFCKHPTSFGPLNSVENGSIEQEVTCPNCKKRWMEVFRLADVRELASKS